MAGPPFPGFWPEYHLGWRDADLTDNLRGAPDNGDAPVDGAIRSFAFAGSTKTSTENDLENITAGSITFSCGAGSFILAG